MSVKDVGQWLIIAGMLLGGGMWLGRLQQQVTDQAAKASYLYGSFSVPEAK